MKCNLSEVNSINALRGHEWMLVTAEASITEIQAVDLSATVAFFPHRVIIF